MDRIDLCASMPGIGVRELTGRDPGPSESSLQIRSRVERAMKMQRKRFQGLAFSYNSEAPGDTADRLFALSSDAITRLNGYAEKTGCSARSYYRLKRVARTIADLEENETVESRHMSEAISYRTEEDDVS